MANHAPPKQPIYPPEWSVIAYKTKQDRGWKCQSCGILQGEDLHNNITVHHRDHDTINNDPDNLLVLCQKCHLYLEGDYRLRQRTINHTNHQLRHGQRVLPGFSQMLFPQLNIASFKSPRLATEADLEHTSFTQA